MPTFSFGLSFQVSRIVRNISFLLSQDHIFFPQDPDQEPAPPAPPPPAETPEEFWKTIPGNLYVKHLKTDEFDSFLK